MCNYLVVVGGEGRLQLRNSRHTHNGVLDVVCLEQSLQDLAGTQRVHIWVGQHQHMLYTRERERERERGYGNVDKVWSWHNVHTFELILW